MSRTRQIQATDGLKNYLSQYPQSSSDAPDDILPMTKARVSKLARAYQDKEVVIYPYYMYLESLQVIQSKLSGELHLDADQYHVAIISTVGESTMLL